MGGYNATSAGGNLSSNRLENIDVFLATTGLALIAAAQLIALILITR